MQNSAQGLIFYRRVIRSPQLAVFFPAYLVHKIGKLSKIFLYSCGSSLKNGLCEVLRTTPAQLS